MQAMVCGIFMSSFINTISQHVVACLMINDGVIDPIHNILLCLASLYIGKLRVNIVCSDQSGTIHYDWYDFIFPTFIAWNFKALHNYYNPLGLRFGKKEAISYG